MTAPDSRLPTLDIMRGFAVMGILAMNIVAFALPEAASLNPLALGVQGWADKAAWAVVFLLVDGKMRALFAMLFGASMLLAMDRAEMSGRHGRHAQYWRLGWLGLIGLAHYLLLWWGDILLLYALVGLIALLYTDREPVALVKLAFIMFGLHLLVLLLSMGGLYFLDYQANQPGASARDLAAYAKVMDGLGRPGSDWIAQELAVTRGDWAGIFAARLGALPEWLLTQVEYSLLDTLGFMLLGMAMLKSGFLTGQWQKEQYRQVAQHALRIGLLPLAALAAWVMWTGFATLPTYGTGFAWSFPFRIPLAVGYAAFFCLLAGAHRGKGWLARVGAVGRMSLSNYLLSSLAMTFLFYGWGLGQFGYWSRAQLILCLPPLWLAMLLWSPLWLARFRTGPAEWLWRCLEQRKLLPLMR